MFKINKNNTEFIFLEAKEKVTVYRSKNNQVSKLTEFNLTNLTTSMESLKKSHSEISKSKNTWLLTTRTENIEKAPLDKAEMFNYAKWKIQEIIDIPLTDIYYDILTNNDIDNNFYKKYATAIITSKSHIDSILNAFSALNIPLKAIDCTETALLDFFQREHNLVNKKALSFLRIEEDRAVMCIYFDGGVALNRVIELPLLKEFIGKENEINEEVYRIIADKLSLEIQRNIDYLDRQYGVQYFENIIYSLPRNSILINLIAEISQYFSVKSIDLYSSLDYKSADEEIIPVEVLASFERTKVRSEHINLIPKIEKITEFNDDLKKVLAISLLTGLVFAGIGSYYEMQNTSLEKEITDLKLEKTNLDKNIKDIKAVASTTSTPLEQEISNLIRNKNEIIKMQALQSEKNMQSYNQVMRDLAIKASNAGVVLSHIKYDEQGILLEGTVQRKELFTDFINKLQTAETLKGKSLSLISIQQNGDSFEFKVSSENIGG